MLKLGVGIPPTPSMDFDFNDAQPMPFLSAPSTPRRFGDFSMSAPSSPSRMAEFYRSLHDFEDGSYRQVGFTWEDRPAGTPKAQVASPGGSDDFAFDFRSELEENSLYAEELFDGGKIKLLRPEDKNRVLSPIAGLTSNYTSRRGARSLSPYRVSEYPWEEEEEERKSQEDTKKQSATSKTSKSSSRKWRLKDFLLFRSASEGRASDKHYKYYPSFFRKPEDHAKNTSFSSTDSSAGSAGRTRRKGQMSAHELHYKTNKAASEDLKKKTYLPYKQGIMGRFAFSPSPHPFVNGFGSHYN